MQSSTTPSVFYNLTQFWSCLPGDNVRSQKLRAQSHKSVPTPLHMSITNSRSSGYPASIWRGYKLELPMTPLPGFHSFVRLTELRKTYTHVYQLTKNYNKRWTARLRVRSGRDLNSRASVPVELGCIIVLVLRCVYQPGSSFKPLPLVLAFYESALT